MLILMVAVSVRQAVDTIHVGTSETSEKGPKVALLSVNPYLRWSQLIGLPLLTTILNTF